MAGVEEFQFQENEAWSVDVQDNLTYLTTHIGDLRGILTRLIQHNVISDNEREIILNEQHHPTTMEKNYKLLTTLKSKGWSKIKPILIQILRETPNENCADLIEFHSIQQYAANCEKVSNEIETNHRQCIYTNKRNLIGAINSKWWPEEIRLPNAFFERKIGEELLTEKLKNILTHTENKMTVINQQVAVSGLGGIGKTTTAKSFAVKYTEDYDLILWMDCGEGSLLSSFTKLARDLDLEKREELELKELACRSFELLKESKCLFIFDNAECYVGKEGIRDVLPKNYNNFHVVITSRNREWGQENIDGTISEFQLDVFNNDEGLEFMKKNTKNLKTDDEAKIRILCDLLGYLPLALQIAVSTLNKQKISFTEYIEKVKANDDILHTTLDDYERTIQKTLKITLELIQNHERKIIGEIAIKILSIFGYITPDAVDVAFFIAVQAERKGFVAKLKENYFSFKSKKMTGVVKKENEVTEMIRDVNEATDLLQFYSIITKAKVSEETTYSLSIHRLFQQVMRHNTRETQNQILRQIFHCKGFLEYKLIPFTHYTDEELKKEFSKIESELIQKLELEKLLKQRRFKEALELSRLIKDSIKSPVSVFNFALCHKYNNDNVEARKILEELLNNTKISGDTDEFRITDYLHFSLVRETFQELKFEEIAWQLFLICYEDQDLAGARKIFSAATEMTLEFCYVDAAAVCLLLQLLEKLVLYECKIRKPSFSLKGFGVPPYLKEFKLLKSTFIDEDGKELPSTDISLHFSDFIPISLELLGIDSGVSYDSSGTRLIVSLNDLKFLSSVHFWNCDLILVNGVKITPKNLTLDYVNFLQEDKQPISNILVNDFVDFGQMKFLDLSGSEMSIDLCDPLYISEVHLSKTKVVDWEKANWAVNKLQLIGVNFLHQTGMKITDIEIIRSSVDISVLPPSIQKLKLSFCTLVNFSFSSFPDSDVNLRPRPLMWQLDVDNIATKEHKKKKLQINNDDLFQYLVPNSHKWKITRYENENRLYARLTL